MATPSYARSLVSLTKRLRLSSPATLTSQCQHTASAFTPPTQRRQQSTSRQLSRQDAEAELQKIRLPRAVQATYLEPLRHKPIDTDPLTCELQLRSYSVRNLEVFADFAMRAAYYLKLSALGPIPLPKITERWTVPRSNFVHKKSQENFERITRRREIKIIGGHPETVAAWLGFVKKYQYYGVGMKANVFDSSDLNVSQDLDKVAEDIESKLAETAEGLPKLPPFMEKYPGQREERRRELEVSAFDEPFKQRWGGFAAMGPADFERRAGEERFERVRVNSVGVERRLEAKREGERARAQGREEADAAKE